MRRSELESVILAWWHDEADSVASCPIDPALCRRPHVFEEATRVPGGAIVACTVHGDRLAASLATHLEEVFRQEHERLVRLAEDTKIGPATLASFSEQMGWVDPPTFRREREGNWTPPVPPPGMPARPEVEQGRCGGRLGGGRCTCMTPEQHYGEQP